MQAAGTKQAIRRCSCTRDWGRRWTGKGERSVRSMRCTECVAIMMPCHQRLLPRLRNGDLTTPAPNKQHSHWPSSKLLEVAMNAVSRPWQRTLLACKQVKCRRLRRKFPGRGGADRECSCSCKCVVMAGTTPSVASADGRRTCLSVCCRNRSGIGNVDETPFRPLPPIDNMCKRRNASHVSSRDKRKRNRQCRIKKEAT